jgi:hypothetical protein
MRYIDPTNAIRYPVSSIPKLIQARKQLLKLDQRNLSKRLLERLAMKRLLDNK